MSNRWPLVPLGELLTPVTRPETVDAGKTYRILGAHWYAQGLYVKGVTTEAGIQAKSLYRVEEGDFVYNRLFAWKGSFALATTENHGCYVSNEFPCFAVNKSRLDGRFLGRFFSRSSVWDDALSESTGGTPTSRNRLKEHKFLAFKIPLPPLEVQRRIVARIEQLAAKIQEARHLRQEADEHGKTVVRATARKALGQVGAPLTPLASWVDTACDAIQTGPFGAQLSSSDFVESGVPLLTIGNVQFGGLDRVGLRYVTNEKAEQLSRYRIVEGDILFARMGTVGRCCIVPVEAEGWLINYHIIRVRLDKVRVDPRYIHWTIQASGDVESYLEEKIRGATRQGVNSGIVGSIPCRVPDLPEQRRIVACLDGLQARVDALKKLQSETAAELDALLPSLLDMAFKAEL